jgi:hypothetical protein
MKGFQKSLVRKILYFVFGILTGNTDCSRMFTHRGYFVSHFKVVLRALCLFAASVLQTGRRGYSHHTKGY